MGCQELQRVTVAAAALGRLDLTNCAALSAPPTLVVQALGRVALSGTAVTRSALRAALPADCLWQQKGPGAGSGATAAL